MAIAICADARALSRTAVSVSAVWRNPGIVFTPVTTMPSDADTIWGVQGNQVTGKSMRIRW